jgi:hypothetical protein
MRKSITLATATLVLLAIAACGSGGNDDISSDDPPPAPTETLSPIQQLAIMVLPLDAYGSQYKIYDVDEKSGPLDANATANYTVDPNDTADIISSRGFTRGYDLNFERLEIVDLGLFGTYYVSSEVDQFRDAESVSAYIQKDLADTLSFINQPLRDFTLNEFTTFDAAGIGDETVGVHYTTTLAGGKIIYSTAVWIRIGNYLAEVGMANTYDGKEEDEAIVIGWAHKLENRIQEVLDGKLQETPVPLRSPTDSPAATQ